MHLTPCSSAEPTAGPGPTSGPLVCAAPAADRPGPPPHRRSRRPARPPGDPRPRLRRVGLRRLPLPPRARSAPDQRRRRLGPVLPAAHPFVNGGASMKRDHFGFSWNRPRSPQSYCFKSWAFRRTRRWPRTANRAALNRAFHPSRVPMDAVSESRPCVASCAQPGEPGVKRVLGEQEGLLAVEDRRVGAAPVLQAVDLAGPERELDAPKLRRVGVGLELGVDQVGDLAGLAVQLDQVRPPDLPKVRSSAPLEDPQQRVQRIERGPVDIEGVGQQLPHLRAAAGLVHYPPPVPARQELLAGGLVLEDVEDADTRPGSPRLRVPPR